MKKMKKVLSLGLVAAMCFSFAACGTPNTPASSGGTTAGQSSGSSKGGPTGEVTMWAHANDSFNNVYKEFATEYMAEHPGTKINIEIFPYDDLDKKTRTAFAAGTEADIIQGFGSWFYSINKNDLLDHVPADMSDTFKTDYYEAAVNGFLAKDYFYAVPIEVNLEYGLYYRTKDLETAGATEIPATFDEYLKIAQKMTQRDGSGNVTRAGFDYYNSDDVFFLFFSWILQQGGTYLAEDGIHLDITTPEAEKAFELFKQMATGETAVTDIKRISPKMPIEQLFIKDASASLVKGPWAYPSFVENGLTDFKYTIMPPAFGTKNEYIIEPGWAMVVSSRSKNKELAWDFIRYATTKDNAKRFALSTSTIPALQALSQDKEFLAAESIVPVVDAYTNLDKAVAVDMIDPGKTKDVLFNKALLRVINGEDIAKALADAEKEINDQFDNLLQ